MHMTSQPRSNIRAYVHWRTQSVFAGEEIECIITFKNIGPPPATSNGFVQSPSIASPREFRYAASTAQTTASSRTRPAHTRNTSIASTQQDGISTRGHRPTLSLNLGRSTSRGGGTVMRGGMTTVTPAGRGHGRSLSIMSMGNEALADRRPPTTISATRKSSRGGHSRSASFQFPQRSSLQALQSMTTLPARRHSPLCEASTPPALPADSAEESLPIRPVRRKPGTTSAGNTPQLRQSSFPPIDSTDSAMPDFEFPPRKTSLASSTSPEKPKPVRNPASMHSSRPPYTPRVTDSFSSTSSNSLHPINRVLSETSAASGTPRSSMDLYSLSNNSEETLTSEAQSQAPGYENGQHLPKPVKTSRKADVVLGPSRPETLMMGYARATGSFILDSSLVDNAPFEDIKRKTVQSDGGVVGVERPKRSSGVFGFGWSNFGESLGGLLGGNEMSTIAQMKASAGSKSISLLSTPQSLLFVDITLAPGESKSYKYHFPLPKGLPPTHKGRAIKVEYTLAIGVQRPDGQSVKYVDIPFRVLGSVNAKGVQLGHDLLSPYVLLQDIGRSQTIPSVFEEVISSTTWANTTTPLDTKDPKLGLESFLRYTERLLDGPKDVHGALRSPTEPVSPAMSRKSSIFEQVAANSKEAIDFALLNANVVLQSGIDSPADAQSANRFTIARSGQTIAVLTLLRPAFRLGENVTGNLDLTIPAGVHGAQSIPAYSIYIELHTSEEVDPSLAIRSEASIQRITKRIHAATRENTLFARKIAFKLAIPATATPTFETTGVSLSWTMKIEFTTFRPLRGPGAPETDQGGDQLLEELSRDERGISLIAKERLAAETFDIAVPIRVYGAFSITDADKEPEALEV